MSVDRAALAEGIREKLPTLAEATKDVEGERRELGADQAAKVRPSVRRPGRVEEPEDNNSNGGGTGTRSTAAARETHESRNPLPFQPYRWSRRWTVAQPVVGEGSRPSREERESQIAARLFCNMNASYVSQQRLFCDEVASCGSG